MWAAKTCSHLFQIVQLWFWYLGRWTTTAAATATHSHTGDDGDFIAVAVDHILSYFFLSFCIRRLPQFLRRFFNDCGCRCFFTSLPLFNFCFCFYWLVSTVHCAGTLTASF